MRRDITRGLPRLKSRRAAARRTFELTTDFAATW